MVGRKGCGLGVLHGLLPTVLLQDASAYAFVAPQRGHTHGSSSSFFSLLRFAYSSSWRFMCRPVM